jgi:hypothetical protein
MTDFVAGDLQANFPIDSIFYRNVIYSFGRNQGQGDSTSCYSIRSKTPVGHKLY